MRHWHQYLICRSAIVSNSPVLAILGMNVTEVNLRSDMGWTYFLCCE